MKIVVHIFSMHCLVCLTKKITLGIFTKAKVMLNEFNAVESNRSHSHTCSRTRMKLKSEKKINSKCFAFEPCIRLMLGWFSHLYVRLPSLYLFCHIVIVHAPGLFKRNFSPSLSNLSLTSNWIKFQQKCIENFQMDTVEKAL